MDNLQKARTNMIIQQIRPWDVTEDRILDLMQNLPREQFVPKGYEAVAYSDTAIPLNHQHFMLQPKIVARALQALNIQPNESVLEIGTGTGYSTVLLAQLSAHVYSVDIEPELHEKAKKLVGNYVKNATLELGDAANGWEHHAPYDVIFISGSYPLEVPPTVIEQLAQEGRCFAVVGQEPAMRAMLITRNQTGLKKEALFETRVPALMNAPKPPGFIF